MFLQRGMLIIICNIISFYSSELMAATERKFIEKGMNETEVLVRIGRPDYEAIDSGGGSKHVVKRWIYFPADGDNQTTTTITIAAGKVINVDRMISRRVNPNASERKFIEKGMKESEVLVRIGRPDYEAIDSGDSAEHVVKRWIYFPADADIQRTTTLTISEGKVIKVDRIISR